MVNLKIESVTEQNLQDVRSVSSAVLPINYAEKNPMWQHILQSGGEFSHVAYDILQGGKKKAIGAIGCRLEVVRPSADQAREKEFGAQSGAAQPSGDSSNGSTEEIAKVKLYVLTLAVLAPYRGLGIGRALIEKTLNNCTMVNANSSDSGYKIQEVYLHVHCINDDALAFYKKFGFEVVELLKGYYKRVQPPDAYLVRKILVSA